MLLVNDLVEDLQKYLEVSIYKDYCHNGLQVQGNNHIGKLVTGVSANLEFLQTAAKLKADTVLVHHGIFWKGDRGALTGSNYRRVKCLIENNISLLAYHLPLDAHTEIGNNYALGKSLDISDPKYYTVNNIPRIIWSGNIKKISSKDLAHKLSELYKQDPIHIATDLDKDIERIAWCTGAAQDYIEFASSLNVDAFITGEISERTVHLAKEYEIEFFAAGHHATEKQGIKNLGQYIADKYDINHTFCDVPNPI